MKSLLRVAAFVRSLVVATLAGSVALAQGNLLVNGSAETGDLSGWTDPIAHGFTVTSAPTSVYAGSFSFHAGQFGPSGAWNHELRQDVDVSALAAMIDAATVTSVFSGVGRTNEAGGTADPGSVVVEFRGGAGNVLASYASGTIAPYNAWQPLGDMRVMPAGTRTVRVRLLGQRTSGLSTDCFFDALELRADCGATTYCTAKTNSLGCTPAIGVVGAASVSSSSLVVSAAQVLNNKSGLLFWGRAASSAPFQGGTLCVAPPTLRTPVQLSAGAPTGDDCSGTYSYAFSSSYLAASSLAVADDVYCQFWSRDPASPSTTGLSDAAHFRVCP
jgi:hypothetical protein